MTRSAKDHKLRVSGSVAQIAVYVEAWARGTPERTILYRKRRDLPFPVERDPKDDASAKKRRSGRHTVGSEGGDLLIAEQRLFSCRTASPNPLQRRRPTTHAAAIQAPTVQAPRTT